MAVELCLFDGCRRVSGHAGGHDPFPTEAWDFFEGQDRNKIDKASYATPRGGAKGAYQNHVKRSGRVIIPYERLNEVDVSTFHGSYVIRIYPSQYFTQDGEVRAEFQANDAPKVGVNAFVLYRTYAEFEKYPPPAEWSVRGLAKDEVAVARWGSGVVDTGEYVLRLTRAGADQPKRVEGPPQGIFAPEYADPTMNYLCQCVLAWLTIYTHGSPYTTTQADHLRAILEHEGLADFGAYENRGALRHGLTSCPLCLRVIRYRQLHELVRFEEGSGLVNAAVQVEGATRSTDANLFHLVPLVYGALDHTPASVTWGHATCNTRLGQRRCYSLAELQEMDLKLGILHEDGVETIGWISADYQMIRSPNGAVWIQLSGDMSAAELEGAPPEPQPPPEDEAEVPIADGAEEPDIGVEEPG